MGQKRKAENPDVVEENQVKKAKKEEVKNKNATQDSPAKTVKSPNDKPKSPKPKQELKKKKAKSPKTKKAKLSKTNKAVKVDPADEAAAKKTKWTNKTRVLVFSSRGISFQGRHLMKDISHVMPHSKSDSKLERKEKLFAINELCEMRNCTKCIYFESRKKMDLYMWLASAPNGPSAKFLVENVNTMHSLKMTGNCLRGSRPLLSFDQEFDKKVHWQLLKEMFIQVFGTPHNHPKSQPFFDRVIQFSIAGGKIWFRSFEIVNESGELVEIGPRMTLNPICIFRGSFCGETLYKNPDYVTPNSVRSLVKRERQLKYQDRVHARLSREARREDVTYPTSALDDVFQTEMD